MKKPLLLILFLVLFSGTVAASAISDIPWGSTQDTVKVMMQKDGYQLSSSNQSVITFTKPLEQYDVVATLDFFKDRLHTISLDFRIPSTTSVKMWHDFVREGTKKYGNPVNYAYTVPANDEARAYGYIMYEGAKATVSFDFSQNGVASSVTAFVGRDGHLHITYKDAKFKAPAEITETKKTQPVKQQPAVAINAEDLIFLLDTLPRLGDRGAVPSFMQALGGDEQDGYFSGSYNNFDVQVEFNSGVVVKLMIEPQGEIGSYNSGIVLEKLYAIYGTPTYSFPTDYRWSFKSRPIRSIDYIPQEARFLGIWQLY